MKHETLIEILVKINDPKVMRAFLKDLCTEKELQDFSDRLDVAQRLLKKDTYEKISKETAMSSATIARVNRAIMYGDQGYLKALSLLKNSDIKNQ